MHMRCALHADIIMHAHVELGDVAAAVYPITQSGLACVQFMFKTCVLASCACDVGDRD